MCLGVFTFSSAFAQTTAEITTAKLRPLSQIGGAANALAIQSNYSFVNEGSALLVYDISDPIHPQQIVKVQPVTSEILDIAIDGSFAYLSLGSAGIDVVDISKLSNPKVRK